MPNLHHPPDIVLFFGRFHVLLVHLPIGMLMLLAALEVFALFPRSKNANASAGFILALAAPLTVLTAVCGWMLSLGGGYSANLLAWHERLGIATAIGCVLAAVLFWRRKLSAYRVVLFLTVAVLTAAGHLGGSLTHGSDYLTRYAPVPDALVKLLGTSAAGRATVAPAVSESQTNSRDIPAFAGLIAPVFRDKCVNCHGPDKSKGGLRLDSYAALLVGGDDGLILNSNNFSESELLRRVTLPAYDDDHMPPDGKPQLTSAELALLKWWVEAGAPNTNAVASLHPPQVVADRLAAPVTAK